MAKTVSAVERDTPEVAEARPPRRRRLLLAGAAAVVLVAGAGAFLLGGDGGDDGAGGQPLEGDVVEVAQVTANLSGAQLRYARVTFSVVLAEDAVPGDVEGRFPLLQDAALGEIQAFDAERLRTPQGADELRAGLSARARELYPDGQVLRVVLTELLVQ